MSGQAPHVIRLRGPWESDRGRVKLPVTWRNAFGDATPTVTLVRRFNRPSGLEPGQRLLLRIGSPHRIAQAVLNDTEQPLEADCCDVTTALQASNLLSVTLDQREYLDQDLLSVQLEIA